MFKSKNILLKLRNENMEYFEELSRESQINASGVIMRNK